MVVHGPPLLLADETKDMLTILELEVAVAAQMAALEALRNAPAPQDEAAILRVAASLRGAEERLAIADQTQLEKFQCGRSGCREMLLLLLLGGAAGHRPGSKEAMAAAAAAADATFVIEAYAGSRASSTAASVVEDAQRAQEGRGEAGAQGLRARLFVCGHIHEAAGTLVVSPDSSGESIVPPTLFVNASTCNLRYRPVNPPIVVDLPWNKSQAPRIAQGEPRCSSLPALLRMECDRIQRHKARCDEQARLRTEQREQQDREQQQKRRGWFSSRR